MWDHMSMACTGRANTYGDSWMAHDSTHPAHLHTRAISSNTCIPLTSGSYFNADADVDVDNTGEMPVDGASSVLCDVDGWSSDGMLSDAVVDATVDAGVVVDAAADAGVAVDADVDVDVDDVLRLGRHEMIRVASSGASMLTWERKSSYVITGAEHEHDKCTTTSCVYVHMYISHRSQHKHINMYSSWMYRQAHCINTSRILTCHDC